ncbi:S41 family peptidase [Pseudoalteromonas xiamenensis]|uniref:S41 family peptidase n=1 Tax=Pseudoalteromonas xiamenensis TaxID=882626 RepID=UPI0035EC8208
MKLKKAKTMILAMFVVNSFSIYAAQTPSMLQGVWQTKGYGYLFDFSGSDVTIYETTSLSCIKSGLTAGQLNTAGTWTFPVTIPGFINANMYAVPGDAPNSLVLHRSDTSTYMQANKISSLPSQCTKSMSSAPTVVSRVFVANFNEQYAYAKEKVAFLPKHTRVDSMTPHELFVHLTQLVKPLKDPHIALVAPSVEGYYFGNDLLASDSENVDIASIRTTLSNIYGKDIKLHSRLQEKIVFAKLTANQSYLAIRSFTGFAREDSWNTEELLLRNTLDEVFREIGTSSHLVLDIRNNEGGSDNLALLMASYFTDKPYLAYNKQAVSVEKEIYGWTQPSKVRVEPNPSFAFRGQLSVLVNRATVSAGETFVMALMGRSPAITIFGQATAGHFSDMLPRTLPNGWLFALPNERYTDENSASYAISGIQPNIIINNTDSNDALLSAATTNADKP